MAISLILNIHVETHEKSYPQMWVLDELFQFLHGVPICTFLEKFIVASV